VRRDRRAAEFRRLAAVIYLIRRAGEQQTAKVVIAR
jgi:hypothetical protein